jgi:hypothetical protein
VKTLRQRLENDVALATPFDLAAGGDAFRVPKQNDLQQDGGRVSRSAVVIVSVFWIEHLQVELLFDQEVQCVFKGARLNLILEVYDYHRMLVVVVRDELGHGTLLNSDVRSVASKRYLKEVFLQPERRSQQAQFGDLVSHYLAYPVKSACSQSGRPRLLASEAIDLLSYGIEIC